MRQGPRSLETRHNLVRTGDMNGSVIGEEGDEDVGIHSMGEEKTWSEHKLEGARAHPKGEDRVVAAKNKARGF